MASTDLTQLAQSYLAQHPEFGTKLTGSLGSGYNGQVWQTDKGVVVKVTRDGEEYQTTRRLLGAANGKFTPKYFACEPLASGLYVVVMEKVTPLQLSAAQSQLLNVFRDRLLDMLEDGENVQSILPAIAKLPDVTMRGVLGGLAQALDGLHKLGIDHADVQEDNLAWRGQQLVLLDVVHAGLLTESTYHTLRRGIMQTLALLREHIG
jgi:hypothetical protein